MHKLWFRVRRSRAPRLLIAALSASLLLTLVGPIASALALVAPAASTPDLSPQHPGTSESLVATTQVTDLDLDTVSVHFTWRLTRGGLTCTVRQHDSTPAQSPSQHADTLDLATTAPTSSCSGGSDPGTVNPTRGDTITVEVTPSDAGGSGATQSNFVVVANTPPTLASVAIAETSPATSDILHATLGATHDDDGDAVGATYRWERNSGSGYQEIPGETDSALDLSKPGNGNKGNTIRVIATPTDGADEGASQTSEPVAIGNSSPVANGGAVSTDEDVAKTIQLTASDADGPDDALTIRVTSLPTNGDLYDGTGTGGHHIVSGELPYPVTDPADNVTYLPSLNSNGSDSFAFNASDGTTQSADAVVAVTVNAVNDAPGANNDGPVTVAGGDTVQVDVLANDTPGGGGDESSQVLTVTEITALPAHGTAAVVGNKVQYSPSGTYAGPDSLEYRVCDDGSVQACATAAVSFNVTTATVADVSVTKTGPAEVAAGDTFAYTITVSNAGPAAALNVQVTDPLPGGLQFQAADNGGVYAAGTNTVTWNLGTRPPGSSIALSLTVKVPSTALTPFDNTATASSTSTDLLPGNNASTAHTTIRARDVVFVSNRAGGDLDIFEMYANGTGQVNVTPTSGACDRYPAWSPDGTKIAFSSTRATSASAPCQPASGAPNGVNAEIYVMNADGTNVTPAITSAPGLDVQPTWSPDGSQIAYSSQGTTAKFNVFKTASDGSGTPVKLTNKVCNDGTRGCSPDWSPDGTTIAFVRMCASTKNCPTSGELFKMPAAAPGAMTKLTSNAVDEGAPTWSPNGARLLLWRFDGKDNEIAMMNADGTRQTFLTADPSNDVDPSWLPTGASIVYSSNRTSNAEITFRDLATPGAPPNLSNDAGADSDPDYRAA